MGQYGQYNGAMSGQGQQYQQMPGVMGSTGYGQPAPGLFSGGGALPSQSSTEQPRPGPKESTFDFVGVRQHSQIVAMPDCALLASFIGVYTAAGRADIISRWVVTASSTVTLYLVV